MCGVTCIAAVDIFYYFLNNISSIVNFQTDCKAIVDIAIKIKIIL